MKQPSFAELKYAKNKVTSKERFLSELYKVISWKRLERPSHTYHPGQGGGRLPKGLAIMLRIYFTQQWYGLTDPAVEDSLYGSQVMWQFTGVALDRIPDGSIFLNFRHLLEHHQQRVRSFAEAEGHLSEKGLRLNKGTIVNASIIALPLLLTKKQQRKRDSELKQTRKGSQWHFGIKVHIGTDTQGSTRSVVVTDAATHDTQVIDDLLHGEERIAYVDNANVDRENQAEREADGVIWRIIRNENRRRQLSAADSAFNHKNNGPRSYVAHMLRIVKAVWTYTNARDKGLAKHATQVFTLFAMANIHMMCKVLLPGSG